MDRLSAGDLAELAALCPGGVRRNVDLAAISQWRIGGRADLLLCPASASEVAALMRWFTARGLRPVVIGLTSNLLFDDAGLHVPCIQIGARMGDIGITATKVEVGAGAWVPGLARRLMQAGLGGAEHICGIPGTLGGLICMNGGSQRKGIGSAVLSVETVSPTGAVRRYSAADCGFGYRRSIFQTNGAVITRCQLHFTPRPCAVIRAEMRAILADRRAKFPRKQPNCGSVFKSNPALYAEIGPPGAIIERLGFKGQRIGGAQVSPRHANFIVNTGGATARDVLHLVARIRAAVAQATGHLLQAEPFFLRADGQMLPADAALTESTA